MEYGDDDDDEDDVEVDTFKQQPATAVFQKPFWAV